MDEPLQILLIEDDEVDRMMARRALKASGLSAEFAEAPDGRAGVQLLLERAFDCALVDYRLPDMDGLGVLRAVRGAGVSTPVIMLTGQGDEQLAVDLMKAGANDYLSKTRLSRDLLTHAVRHVVRLHRAQSEAQLARGLTAESEQRFRTMADSAPILLWVSDIEGGGVYFNQGWLDFTGRTMEQERGEGWIAGIHPEDKDLSLTTCERAFDAREKFEMEFRLRRHDGQYRWVLDTGAPRFLPDGSFAGYIGTCLDITERKRIEQERAELLAREQSARAAAEESERHYRFLAESIPQLVWTCLPDGQCDYLSQQWVNYTGVPEREQLGLRWLQMLHPEDRDRAAQVWREAVAGRSGYDLEYRIRRHDGVYRWFKTRGLRLPDSEGRTLKWFGTCTDIENQKRQQQELIDARDAAEKANAAKDQFLAVLSHELRTPLAPILTTVQAMQSEPGLPADVRRSVEMIRRNVELEARLIDDLLDLTRIAKGKLQLDVQTIDAHEALNSALDICRDDIFEKGLTLHTDLRAPEHFVRADSARLHQVFWNLIKNAVKFTPEGGSITIRSTNEATSDRNGSTGEERGRLWIEVRDTGIGIEPQVLPRIFDAFEQGERSITRRFGGLGLGLAISKALIDMQSGRLVADSAGKDRGSVFAVDLPTTEPVHTRQLPGGRGAVGAEGGAAPRDVKILLVEDHEDTVKAMRRLLQRLGYQVTTADSVAAGLDAFANSPFDLLISDIGLPDGSGLELMRQLRERVPGRPVRGIALSGFGMEEDVRKSKEAGFFEHLTKPINFQKLEAVIRDATATAPSEN